MMLQMLSVHSLHCKVFLEHLERKLNISQWPKLNIIECKLTKIRSLQDGTVVYHIKPPYATQVSHEGPVPVLVASFPIQIHVDISWENSRTWPTSLGPNPSGRLRRSSQLLDPDRPNSGHCSHLDSEPANGSSLDLFFFLLPRLSLPLYVYLSFINNK